jgi:hypothetical protein
MVRRGNAAADFLAFMRKVVHTYPELDLHLNLDNSSTHGTPDVRGRLAAQPQVPFNEALCTGERSPGGTDQEFLESAARETTHVTGAPVTSIVWRCAFPVRLG